MMTASRRIWRALSRLVTFTLLLVTVTVLLPSSGLTATGRYDLRLGELTARDSFSLTLWTIDAVADKVTQAFGAQPWAGLTEQQRDAVFESYFASAGRAVELEGQIADLANQGASESDPGLVELERQLAELRATRQEQGILVERIMEDQVQAVLTQQDISILRAGRLFLPPVFFRPVDLPHVLVISYADRIEMRSQVAVKRTLTVKQVETLEAAVDQDLDVSSLVVPIGGYSTYPTMVSGTGPRDWMVGAVSHEWCHIYLTFRPLGVNYNASGQLAAMNETVCSIFGDEVSSEVGYQFYGLERQKLSWQTPPQPQAAAPVQPPQPPEPQTYNVNRELRRIYLAAEQALKAGDRAGAIDAMAQGRKDLAAHGFYLRKLNQAYFAFYGSYAEGENAIRPDPIGANLRTLRRQSADLRQFMNIVSRMTSYADLERAVGN